MVNQKDILIKVIESISKKLIEAEKILTELDSMGDADCGVGVRRGFEAVLNVIPELYQLELGDILKKVGFTLAYTIGGTSGAMLGTGFIETGKFILDTKEPSIGDWVMAMDSALAVIKRRGGNTQIGDKTLVDALEPAVEAMKNFIGLTSSKKPNIVYGDISSNSFSGSNIYSNININNNDENNNNNNKNNIINNRSNMLLLLQSALDAAKEGSDKTIDMVAKKGRASYLGERSRGNRDPGSLVIVIMFEAALEVLRAFR